MPNFVLSRMPPLASERGMRAIHDLIAKQHFSSLEELNAALEQARASSALQAAAEPPPTDPVALAFYLCCEAERLPSDLANTREYNRLLRKALAIDPGCVEADLMLLNQQQLSRVVRIARLRKLVAMAERRLGAGAFEGLRGHFWGELETRAYMRARATLARALAWAGDAEGAAHMCALLELCPGDNLGLRDDLMAWRLRRREPEAALALAGAYPDDTSLVMVWARAIAHAQLQDEPAALGQFRRVFEEYPELRSAFEDPALLRDMLGVIGHTPPDDVPVGGLEEVAYAFCQIGEPAAADPFVLDLTCRALLLVCNPPPRNAPCPCGSGAKFKKCCGRPV